MTREVGTLFVLSFVSAGANASYGYAIAHNRVGLQACLGFLLPLLQMTTVALLSGNGQKRTMKQRAALGLASGTAWASAGTLAMLSLR